MNNISAIFKREFAGYFSTPVAYVFIVIFLFLTGVFTFYIGAFYERNQADLEPFFRFHPWLYLFLIPAIAMRLWSEERKSGTIELLMTLPIPIHHAVIGKFLAAWCFTSVALVLTFPMWITVNYLGTPDNTVILASYIGSLLMAGGFLAIGSCVSAISKSQVIAFVISLVISFLFLLSGFPLVLDPVFIEWFSIGIGFFQWLDTTSCG
jgi:ABC-2 type transport system permease protein